MGTAAGELARTGAAALVGLLIGASVLTAPAGAAPPLTAAALFALALIVRRAAGGRRPAG